MNNDASVIIVLHKLLDCIELSDTWVGMGR